MIIYLWVALGGALGSMARYGVSQAWVARWPGAFPWSTLVINVAGSFLIGLVAVLSLAGSVSAGPTTRAFLMAGVLGGFTTFSAFSLQTLELLQAGDVWRALGNVVGSVGLSLLGVCLGFGLGQMLGYRVG